MNNDLKKILRDLRRKNTDKSNLGIQLNIGDDGLMKMKGQDGYTPVKGVDYWTPEEVEEMVTAIFNAAKPKKGADYYTDSEKRAFVAEVLKLATPVKGRDYRDGKDGKDGRDGKDGANPNPRQVAVDAITLLESFEGDARLSAKALRDLDEAVTEILRKGADFELSEKQITTIKDLLPKYPPMNAGGSGATFLKSLRDVDLSGLTKNADGKYVLGGGSGASTFLDLTDTPSSYSGQAGKFPKVNAGEDALEFVDISGGGDMLASTYDPANIAEQVVGTTATQTVSNKTLTDTDSVAFDLVAGVSVSQGQIAWNADEETIDIGLNGAVLQVGQETLYHVRNNTGSSIANGKPVMATGTIGASSRITVALMDGSTASNAKLFLGITTEDIANGTDGKVTHFGKVRGIQTNGANYGETWSDGDIIYVDPTTAGALTNVAPSAGSLKMPIAIVIFAHATNGTLFVRASSLDENAYAPLSHTHTISDVTDLQTELNNSLYYAIAF